ncbi:hypothetical protein AS189_02720 [Arthrobacter alpinus]|uniref:ABC transporter permease n=1 Tax=Arthrobacter alpinus TaxID=656366 RepID=A0A0S2LW16_9MICC|nr:ABC transporter permease [Arthrobacter alpinus]ALO65602.1 hypothetical protein AS189_02720 [Arthrobacter alpinus]
MSTTTISSPGRATGGSLTFAGVLRSEWIKFRSLRSTQLLLAFTFLAVVGVGAFSAWVRSMAVHLILDLGPAAMDGSGGIPAEGAPKMTLEQAMDVANSQGINLYGTPIAGIQLGILILGALSVMLISSEFGTGMIRSTMTAVPKRLPAFFAKATVLAVVSYVVTLVAAFATFLVSIPIMKAQGIELSLGMDGVVYSILMGGVYVAGVSLIALSLGALLRSSAGAIIVLVALFLMLDIAAPLLGLIPGDFWMYVGQYFPSVSGGRMLEIHDKEAFLSPLAGGLVFLGWIVLIMVPAAISIKTRDV